MNRFFTVLVAFLLSSYFVNARAFYLFHKPDLTGSGKLLIDIKSISDTNTVSQLNQSSVQPSKNWIFKHRLDSIKKDVQLDYNDFVQNYINLYLRNRNEMAQVLGLTKYYFPIYEKAFHDAGIPDEIKYLSIVESKLNPFAVSRVGATGPWQFMFATAKNFGLNINKYVDERKDPIQASYAAAAYLKDAYEEFGDWLLAIASYNCGKTNVEKAIEKAGSSNFWAIRPYLPTETRGYVPAFIAVNYVMNFYNLHNITPKDCKCSFNTDIILVDKNVSLRKVSKALSVDFLQLANLNPQYKRQILNGTSSSPLRLVIPQVGNDKFFDLYNILNDESQTLNSSNNLANPEVASNLPRFHKVRKGETLGAIADNYGIDVHDLKVINHIKGDKPKVGKMIKLSAGNNFTESRSAGKHVKGHVIYTVKSGDTLSGIAAKFNGTSIEKIKSLNRLKKNVLHPGMTIKI